MAYTNRKTYTKPPLTIPEQIARMKRQGLLFDDENEAAAYLFNISYYRLCLYTFPFQDNREETGFRFRRNDIHFRDIVDLYVFDRRMRTLIFNAIEKIEVALRTKIVQVYAETTGNSHWYLDRSLYRDGYPELMRHLKGDVGRSNEDFLKHYKEKYTNPSMPPSWMAFEVISFATLGKMYQSLKLDERKKSIARSLGLPNIEILENWMHAISNLRNCCAHHSRVWNRRFTVSVKLPYNTRFGFMDKSTIAGLRTNKLFPVLSCVAYILNVISPGNEFRANVRHLLNSGCRLLYLKDIGFPDNWESLPVWRLK